MNMNYPTISMRELECWICYGRPMELIDLMNRRAFGYSHLMNAVNFPFEELEALLHRLKDVYPDMPLMADLATLEEAERVAATGCVDIISTTLAGYTRNSMGGPTDRPNVELLREIKKRVSLPVNAEGRIWEVGDLEQVLEAGADMVCIGSAVTRPHLITERFVNCNKKFYHQ